MKTKLNMKTKTTIYNENTICLSNLRILNNLDTVFVRDLFRTLIKIDGMLALGALYLLRDIKANGDGVVAEFDFKAEQKAAIDVECQALYENYLPYKGNQPQAVENKSPLTSMTWKLHCFTSKLSLGLATAAAHYGDMQVVCTTAPSRGAYALEKYKNGELIFVPTTFNVKYIENTKASSFSALDNLLKCGGDVPDGYSFYLGDDKKSDYTCPVWYLQGTSELKKVNLEKKMIEVDINMKTDKSEKLPLSHARFQCQC